MKRKEKVNNAAICPQPEVSDPKLLLINSNKLIAEKDVKVDE